MGKGIAKVESPAKQTVEPELKPSGDGEKEEKANTSESEYSSLEDDDDQGKDETVLVMSNDEPNQTNNTY